MFEFEAGVSGFELPVGFGVVFVPLVFPCFDFVDKDVYGGDAAAEALGSQDAELRLGHVKPGSVPVHAGIRGVMPFEAPDQPSGFGGGHGHIERSFAVCVEIVLHQNEELGAGKVDVGQLFEGMGIVHGGAAVRDFDPHLRGGGL